MADFASLKKTAFLLLIFLAHNLLFANSDSESAKLPSPKKNFAYSDEIIGMALKSTTAKVYNESELTVTYPEISVDANAISRYRSNMHYGYHWERYSYYDRYYYSYDYYYDDGHYVRNSSYTEDDKKIDKEIFDALFGYNKFIVKTKKQWKNTNTWTGSAVVISENGYLATNQHVVETEPEAEEKFEKAFYDMFKKYLVSVYDYIPEYLETLGWNKEFYISEIDKFVESIKKDDEDKNSQSDNSNDDAVISDDDIDSNFTQKLTVVFPDANGNTSYEKGIKYKAEIVKEGKVRNKKNKESGVEDAAILKINASNLVSLPLSPSYPNDASKIITAGFPGISSDMFESVDSNADTLAATITNGIVSRVVPIENSKYKMIQTNAPIEHGNSGGPSVNSFLEIVGLNTFKNWLTDSYNYIVPSLVIKKMTAELPASDDEISQFFMTGLQALQEQKGWVAYPAFVKVAALQPDTPCVNVLIQQASLLPQNEPEEHKNLEILIFIIAIIVLSNLLVIQTVRIHFLKKTMRTEDVNKS